MKAKTFKKRSNHKLQLKVCGMKYPENINELIGLCPQFMGFIFYPKSSRYVNGIDKDFIRQVPIGIKKVGVFVDAPLQTVLSTAKKYNLDYIQLHGNENLEFIKAAKKADLGIIKVFQLMDRMPSSAKEYDETVDYFLFDTASSHYGGSGCQFDWSILQNYHLETPFFLSGGIRISDIDRIKSFSFEKIAGIDVNSQFEVEPGLKDLELIKALKRVL